MNRFLGKTHTIIVLYIVFISSFLLCMDQQDLTIKKIIPVKNVEQVVFLGNDIVVLHKNKQCWSNDFFTKAINLSTNTKTNILKGLKFSEHSTMLAVDDCKEKIMFTYYTWDSWYICAQVYDKEGNIYNIPEFYTQGGLSIHAFGGVLNELLFTIANTGITEVKSCNYITGAFTLQKDITTFIKNNPILYIIKYLADNKILCAKRGRRGEYSVYDFANNQFTNDISLAMGSRYVESSSDGSFIIFNYHPNHTVDCDSIIEKGDTCNCHEIPIVFLNDNKTIKIVDKNDNPKKNHRGRCGLTIHPNNRVIARLKNNVITYWNAYTGKKYDVEHIYNYIGADTNLSYYNTQCLSFSSDGTLIAGAFPNACVILEVPFEVKYGIHIKKEKLFTIWTALKKYHSQHVLSSDILQYIMKMVWEVSKWGE